ncbi:MAG: Ig-like domain-containing protein [Clostridia bacterium]
MESHLCLGCMKELPRDALLCPNCGYAVGTPPEDMSYIWPGTVIGNYLIGAIVKNNFLGLKYIAFDKIENIPVFITRIPFSNRHINPEASNEIEATVKKIRELSFYNEIPNVVKTFDSFIYDSAVYMVTEYFDAVSLNEYIDGVGRKLSFSETRNILKSVFEAVQYANKRAIYHKAINPDYIWLGKDGSVHLSGFGYYVFVNQIHSYYFEPFLSPESSDNSQIDARSDIYSISAVAYFMLTGEFPVSAHDRLFEDTLLTPSKMGVKLPPYATKAIMSGLSVEKNARYPSIEMFASDFYGLSTSNKRENRKDESLNENSFSDKAALGKTVAATMSAIGVGEIHDVAAKKLNPKNTNTESLTSTFLKTENSKSNQDMPSEKVGFVPYKNDIGLKTEPLEVNRTESEYKGNILEKATLNHRSSETAPKLDSPATKIPLKESQKRVAHESFPSKKREFPIWAKVTIISVCALLVVGLLMAILGVFDAFLPQKTIAAPNLIGKTLDTAALELSTNNILAIVDGKTESDAAPGTILLQEPMVNQPVDINGVILVNVAVPKYSGENLPSLKYMGLDESFSTIRAISQYSNVSLMFDENDNIPAGYIINQSIPEGMPINDGDTIALLVSSGSVKQTTALALSSFTKSRFNAFAAFTIGGFIYDVKKVSYGTAIGSNMPPDPVVDDMYFAGWYTAENGNGELFSSGTSVTSSVSMLFAFITTPPETSVLPSEPVSPSPSQLAPTQTLSSTQTQKPTSTPVPTKTSKPTKTPNPTNTTNPAKTPNPTPSPVDTIRPMPTPTPKLTPKPTKNYTPKPIPTPTRIRVTGVMLNMTSITMYAGESRMLTAYILPEDATDQSTTWSSSNSDIASVTGNALYGTVFANRSGTVIITVTTHDGNHQATCTITIASRSRLIHEMYLSAS